MEKKNKNKTISSFSREVKNQRAFSLPGIPISQRNSSDLKEKGGFFSSPWEKGLLHSLPLTKTLNFLNRKLDGYLLSVFSAPDKSV